MTWNLDKDRYNEIREIVSEIIEDYGISSYPLDCSSLLNRIGVRKIRFCVLPFDTQAFLKQQKIDGFTRRTEKYDRFETAIFYNEKMSYERIRFTLAHELGHLFLEHPDTGKKIYEDEANVFASYLLAPSPLVLRDSKCSVKQIMSDFHISYSCAQVVMDRTINRKLWGGKWADFEKRILNICHLEKGGFKYGWI